MARTNTTPLDAGETFPSIELQFVDGSKRTLPGDCWTVVLIYRGQW